MKGRISVGCCVAIIAGCVGPGIKPGLDKLVGQNIEAAIERIGYPDGQRESMGDLIYIWNTQHKGILPYHTPNGSMLVPVTARCTIQIAVNEDATIKRYQFEGNPAGCERYAKALNR